MNKSFVLFKTLRKCRKNTKNGIINGGNMFYVILGICVALILGYAGYILGPMSELFGSTGGIISALGTVTGFSVIFISIKTLIVSMYMSSDIDILITMPLSPMQIVFNRVLDTLISAYMISSIIVLPFVVGYSIGYSVNIKFILASLLVYLFVPAFTIMAVSSILMLVMRLLKVFRSRERLALFGVIAVVILMAAYFLIKKDVNSNDTQQVVTATMSILDRVKYIIPVVPFISKFLTGGSIVNLFIVLGILAFTVGVFYLVSRTCYLGGALNMINARSNSKVLTFEEIEKRSKKRSVIVSIMRKDFFMTLRTPAILMTTYIFLWGIPIVAVIILAFSGVFSSGDATDITKTAQQVYLNDFCIGIMSVLALFPFFGIFTQIACKSVSREGTDFVCMRQIPLTARNFIKAKRNLAFLVMGASTIIFPAILMTVLLVLGKLHWLGCLFGFLICVPMTAVLVNLGVLFDLEQPDLNWSSESDLTKSNRMYGVFILLYFVFNILLCVAVALLSESFNSILALSIIGLLIFAIQTSVAFISSKIMYSNGVKIIKRLTE